MKKILFVCTGNICRSPSAEAIMRHKLKDSNLQDQFMIDSAGTHGYHKGELADKRAREEGERRGISFKGIISRQVTYDDFDEFDFIFAMDRGHYLTLEGQKPRDSKAKLELFLGYVKHPELEEVGDPYYGTDEGFSFMFDILEESIEKLIQKLGSN